MRARKYPRYDANSRFLFQLTQAEPASPPNENIDTSSTNTAEAARKFAGSDFDNSLTNYSSRIDRQQVSFSSGVAGETRDEKLARIKLELQELAESAVNDKEDVDTLHVLLEGLEVKRKELPLLEVKGDVSSSRTSASTDTSRHVATSSHTLSKLVSLESRLSAVESSLYDPNSPESTSVPLAPAIRDLMLKLSLLTSSPQTLQAQQTRIQNVKKGGNVRVESRAESRGGVTSGVTCREPHGEPHGVPRRLSSGFAKRRHCLFPFVHYHLSESRGSKACFETEDAATSA